MSAEPVLELQRCEVCETVQYYPRAVCTTCGSTELTLVPAEGSGTVLSFTTVFRAPGPGFEPPYVVAIVRLDEGPSLLTQLADWNDRPLRCDARVRLRWQTTAEAGSLAVFVPAETE